MSKPDHTEADPTMEDTIRIVVQEEIEAHHGALPVEVVTYDAATQTVEVRPVIRIVTDGTADTLPTIPGVPVRWPASSTHSITFPLAVGDYGRVIPCGGDLGNWKKQGTKLALDVEHRRMDLGDCTFDPGLRPIPEALAAAAIDAVAGVLAGVWKVGSSAAAKAVALHLDGVNKDTSIPGLSFANWMTSVEAVAQAGGGVVVPQSSAVTKIGTVQATAGKLKAE